MDMGQSQLREVERIAAEVARPAAAAVDRDARFPHEAIAALRKSKLLSAAIPEDFGGAGCSLTEICGMCTALGRSCASTAAIFAMHQIQVICIVRHCDRSSFFRDYLREVVQEQRLIASGTSEIGLGGDLRSSVAAVERNDNRFTLDKKCAALSFGEAADAILLTARRDPAAASGDQVLLLLRRQDYRLEKIGSWDTLGMRGTCSPPCTVVGEGEIEQVLPESFQRIASQTMVPSSHILWSATWLGIAADAVAIARRLIQQDARRRPGVLPYGSARLVGVVQDFDVMSAYVVEAAQEYERLICDLDGSRVLSSLTYTLKNNTLKLASSRLVVRICQECLEVCGLRGYTNESDFSVSRQLRDALSATLMIANDRVAVTNANLLLLAKDVRR
jgi:acyl-CoA dehydrogenase